MIAKVSVEALMICYQTKQGARRKKYSLAKIKDELNL